MLQRYLKRLQRRCYPANIVKLLRTTFFLEHLSWSTRPSQPEKTTLQADGVTDGVRAELIGPLGRAGVEILLNYIAPDFFSL